MKIERQVYETMTIEQFAEANNLVMEIRERNLPIGDDGRFFAKFKNCGIVCDNGNAYAYPIGDGATEELAVAAYTKEISMRRIRIIVGKDERREVNVPRLAPAGVPQRPTPVTPCELMLARAIRAAIRSMADVQVEDERTLAALEILRSAVEP